MAQLVKNLPAILEIWVRSLGWEDPLEKGTTTHSSILAWRIPWTEEPGRLQSMGSQRVRHNWTNFTSLLQETKAEIQPWGLGNQRKVVLRRFVGSQTYLWNESWGHKPDVETTKWADYDPSFFLRSDWILQLDTDCHSQNFGIKKINNLFASLSESQFSHEISEEEDNLKFNLLSDIIIYNHNTRKSWKYRKNIRNYWV